MIETLIATLQATRLDVPDIEPFLLVVALTLAILFRLPRSGLLITYLFVYRWCWQLAMQLGVYAQIAYMVFGILAGVLACIAMLQNASHAADASLCPQQE